jgi:NADH:ubiquinone oxidoreductase subunit
MDRLRRSPYIPRMNIGTLLYTWLCGRRVGADTAGNVYYEERKVRPGVRRRRWVLYRGGPVEASRVPPEWHAWLHYTTDAPLPLAARRPWEKPHLANLTGTPHGYRPAGHDYRGGRRAASSDDYEAWSPGS